MAFRSSQPAPCLPLGLPAPDRDFQFCFSLSYKSQTIDVILIIEGIAVMDRSPLAAARLPAGRLARLSLRTGLAIRSSRAPLQAINRVCGLSLPEIDIGRQVKVPGVLRFGAQQRLQRALRARS